jgi:hypothetical protein
MKNFGQPNIKDIYKSVKNPEQIFVEEMYKELLWKIRPDLTGEGQHELALELIRAKKAADQGDDRDIKKLYERCFGSKGGLVDKYV